MRKNCSQILLFGGNIYRINEIQKFLPFWIFFCCQILHHIKIPCYSDSSSFSNGLIHDLIIIFSFVSGIEINDVAFFRLTTHPEISSQRFRSDLYFADQNFVFVFINKLFEVLWNQATSYQTQRIQPINDIFPNVVISGIAKDFFHIHLQFKICISLGDLGRSGTSFISITTYRISRHVPWSGG